MKNFRLDLKNIQRIPFEKYEDKFTFVVDGKEYITSRIVADLLSPIICRYHFEDESRREFIINSSSNSNDKSNLNEKYFDEFLRLVEYDENYEIDEERILALSEIFLAVGNIDEFYKLQGNRLDKQEISRIVELLKFISTKVNNNEATTALRELAGKCASRFDELREEELKALDLSTIEMILNSSKLQIQDEDSLVDLIIKLSRENKSYFSLFEYVFFNNVTIGKLEEFVGEFSIEYLTNGTWSSICDRLLSREGKKIPSKRYKIRYEEKEFKHEEGHEFEGIMRHLTRETGGNIHDNGTIEIMSNSICNDSNSYHPKNLVDYDSSNYYESKDEPGAFIQFDFKYREIQLTNYSIQSYDGGATFGNPRNWKLEVSQDGKNWTKVDEHSNDETLNGSSIVKTFNTEPTELFYRFIKLTQTGKSWYESGNDYNYYLYFPYIEFYGKMRRKI